MVKMVKTVRRGGPRYFPVILTVTSGNRSMSPCPRRRRDSRIANPALGAVLDQGPAELGEHARPVAVALGGLGRGIAVEAALVDALDDGGEAEQREGDIEV